MTVKVDVRELEKHRALINDVNALLATNSGVNFIRYLFESFGVGEMPPINARGEDLLESITFLRTGNSIYKLVAEANPMMAGNIMVQIEKAKVQDEDV